MKFDFLRNKVFIISFIVLILFSFFVSSGVYASSFDPAFDYNYSFNTDMSLDFQIGWFAGGKPRTSDGSSISNEVSNSVLKDDRVVSGDYYFFDFSGESDKVLLYFKKSDISSLYIKFYNISACGNPVYSLFSVNSDGSDTEISRISFFLDYDKKTLTTCFASNYDKPISVYYQNSDKVPGSFFMEAPTFQLTEAVGQIPEIMMKIIKQVLPIGLIVLGVGLLIYLIRHVIYLKK